MEILDLNIERLKGSFCQSFLKVLNEYVARRQKNECYELYAIYISFLYSSAENHLPLFRIDLHDQKSYFEVRECWDYWDSEDIQKKLSYKSNSNKEAAPSIVLKRDWVEQENNNKKQAIEIKCALREHIHLIITDCRNYVDASVNWYYGEYYGEVSKIEQVR